MAKRRRVKIEIGRISARVESRFDRISALPDDLLCHILSLLPTESALRASLLSKRWRNLLTLISSIDISMNQIVSYPKPEKLSQFLNYVERDLLSRHSILRFRLEWDRRCDPSRVNNWITALMCHNIQELELCIKDRPMGSYNVLLPASLFSSETLVVLKLVSGVAADNSSLKIPAKASLPNLKVLHINKTGILDGELEKLLSSCPVLDDLFLSKVFTEESNAPCKLNISNATLRRLAIHPLSLSRAVEVVINCPALEYLSFYIRKNQSLALLAKQCLAEVVIYSYQETSSFYRYPRDFANAREYAVLKEIDNVKSLQILDYSLWGIYKYKRRSPVDLPLFNNLTYLKLSDSTFLFDPHCLEYLLAPCVVLETLVFELRFPGHFIVKGRNDINYTFEQSRLAGLLCHLKTIEIQLWGIRDTDNAKILKLLEELMEIIKFFLNNVKILEELTIRIGDFPYTHQSKMRTELLTIPRASNKCRVVLNDRKVTDDLQSQYNNMCHT